MHVSTAPLSGSLMAFLSTVFVRGTFASSNFITCLNNFSCSWWKTWILLDVLCFFSCSSSSSTDLHIFPSNSLTHDFLLISAIHEMETHRRNTRRASEGFPASLYSPNSSPYSFKNNTKSLNRWFRQEITCGFFSCCFYFTVRCTLFADSDLFQICSSLCELDFSSENLKPVLTGASVFMSTFSGILGIRFGGRP